VRPSKAARSVNWIVYRLGAVKWTALLCLVGLSLWERPVWCVRTHHAGGSQGPYPCETAVYPGWGHKFMSAEVTSMIEGGCLATLQAFEFGHWFAGLLSSPAFFSCFGLDITCPQLFVKAVQNVFSDWFVGAVKVHIATTAAPQRQ
jgi:hypothetical protein